ncbi:hypothetical protein QTP88_010232 [Uroleucon formosanum]
MPKVKTNTCSPYSRLFQNSEFCFFIDESVLFCKFCEVKVNAQKRFTVLQHLKTKKHIRLVNRINKPKKSQQLLEFNLPTKKCQFNKDLCEAMLFANIPLYKLENVKFRAFLQEYTGKEIPKEATLQEQRVRQLINEEEVGDRKPSQFLRHLRSLAGTTTLQDNILRQLWLRRLPSHAQAILTAQSELPLEKVAELADKIVKVQSAPSQFVHAVATMNDKKELDVFAAIEALTKQVSKLCAKRPQHICSRSRSRSNVERSNGKGWCWYHSTYGEKAIRCKAPASTR